MSMGLQYRIYRGVEDGVFTEAIDHAVRDMGGFVDWGVTPTSSDVPLAVGRRDRTSGVLLPYIGGNLDFRFCKALGVKLGCVWLDTRIQENTFWDCVLYRGKEDLDQFSTLPQYWDGSPGYAKEWAGHPTVFASAWGVNVELIQKYMVAWDSQADQERISVTARGAAYAGDDFQYGDPRQLLDFMRALGAPTPEEAESSGYHRLRLPRA